MFRQYKRMVGAALIGLILATGVTFLATPQTAYAAAPPAKWINRGTIKVGDTYFVDGNTTDTTYTYLGQFESCEAKVVFRIDSHNPWESANFFYRDSFYNTIAARAEFQHTSGQRVGDKVSCDAGAPSGAKDPIAPGDIHHRRVTFIKKDENTIINFRNGDKVFKKFKQVAGKDIFRLDDGKDESTPCKDIIVYDKPALINTVAEGHDTGQSRNDEGPWRNNEQVGGSSMLYSIMNDDGGERDAESYADLTFNTSPYRSCDIDNGKVHHNDAYASSEDYHSTIFPGYDDSNSIRYQVAHGMKSSGDYYRGGSDPQNDDAFIIFVGTPQDNQPTDPATGQPVPPGSGPGTGPSKEKVCEDDNSGISHIVCGIIKSVIGGIKTIFESVIKPYLVVAPIAGNQELYKSWLNILNIANILFVITFFFLIFSQATSIGINNYGIKRLLPRLIVAAIATNLSFWICAALIDITNLISAGITGLIFFPLSSAGVRISDASGLIDSFLAFRIFSGFVVAQGGILAAAATILVTGLLILMVIVLLLIVRLMLILLYVVFSPVIFVGFILPGTAGLANRATMGFLGLLFMGPIIIACASAGGLLAHIFNLLPGGP